MTPTDEARIRMLLASGAPLEWRFIDDDGTCPWYDINVPAGDVITIINKHSRPIAVRKKT